MVGQTRTTQSKAQSRLISNDLQNDTAKRPRLSRTRAEKLIKKITNRENPNSDDNGDFDHLGDSDFHDSSDSSISDDDEVESSSDDESIHEEDTEVCKKSGRYQCVKCNTAYGSMYHLRRHLTTFAHTGRNPPPPARTGIPTQGEIASLKCTVCATKFDDVETLTKHKNKHKKECEICDLKFPQKYGLLRHFKSRKHDVALRCRKLNDDGVVTFRCDKCDQVEFPDSHGIFQHVHRIHNSSLGPIEEEISTLRCTICCENFDDLTTLVKHKALHGNKCEVVDSEGNVTFVCERCPVQQSFPDVSKLIKHKENCHQKPRIFPEGRSCMPCDKVFTSTRCYNLHLLSTLHTTTVGGVTLAQILMPTQDEMTSLKCTICAKHFENEATLTKHKSKHGKKCEICDLKFLNEIALGQHLVSQKHSVALRCRRLNEDGVITFSCDKCDHVEFPDLRAIFQHVKKSHKSQLSRAEVNFDETELCTESGRYKCLKCKTTYGSKCHLRRHLTTNFVHTGGNPPNKLSGRLPPSQNEIKTLKCTICAATFDDLPTLVKRKTLHGLECEVCSVTFRRHKTLNRHRQSKSHQFALLARRVDSEGKVSFVCGRCPEGQPFPNYPKLDDHRKENHPGQNIFSHVSTSLGETEGMSLDFACTLCDKKYAANFQLTAHLASAHIDAFVCEICGVRFHSLSGFMSHQKTHVESQKLSNRRIPPEDKSYPCKFCDKRFAQVGGRAKHVNSVHKGRRYKCDVCKNTFATAQSLKHHKKYVHNFENEEQQTTKVHRKQPKSKTLKCDVCSKKFAHHVNLSHIELAHFQDKSKCPYECSNLEFETENEWIQHLEGCTSEKITEASRCSCYYCGALFRHRFLLFSHHLQAHKTFPCEICSKVFTKQQSLTIHTHSHQEARPHLCPKCGKRFRQAWNLKLHVTLICGDDEEARKKLMEKRKTQYKSFRAKKMNFKCDECS
ncbi:zinc finger protein 91 isoform X2 [Folsomia candida]|uniref:zinc finger protein 91 isoform X2 n=1 Tax=Folsomia candida TaxID=158441 RepID=UPI00160529CD|nr:zinc finger protein 91 isoform X2 [Folsomia candida]